ncbi:hypothetical protein D1007_59191 [Hordeum vulgare]|nr:hypothetical protein D1007_59191 [Hordeum vulgare]
MRLTSEDPSTAYRANQSIQVPEQQQFRAELSVLGVANGGHRDAGGGGAREEAEARGAPRRRRRGRRRGGGGVQGQGELRGGDQGVGRLGRVRRRRRVRGQGARVGARQV